MTERSDRKLRCGFTTGTAAAAAAKAALLHLLSGEIPRRVDILLLNDTWLSIPVEACRPLDKDTAVCTVIKDAGDDPDITHGAQIGARVRIRGHAGANSIRITGGRGVGTVTKPGLETPPGQPAITAGPLKMIRTAVEQALAGHGTRADLTVEIFVPQGERLARKTLNARLGIVGGISILGTTGVVKPLSHASYIATIDAALSVAVAMGLREVVLTTGRRSERLAQRRWPAMAEEAFIQMGDYFARTMEMACIRGLERVIIAVFFGKAVKMAQGAPHTHAGSSRLRLERLARWALETTGSDELARKVAGANTARQVFDFVKDDHPELIMRVGGKIVHAARKFSSSRLGIRAVMFDFEGGACFDSAGRQDI